MNNKNICKTTTTLMALFGAINTSFGIIDFESQGATIGDDGSLDPTERFADGDILVRFGIDPDGLANGLSLTNPLFIESVGLEPGSSVKSGFKYDSKGLFDAQSTWTGANLGTNGGLGNYFLRNRSLQEGGTGLVGDSLFVIRYSPLSSGKAYSASGEIWDIDGNSLQGTEKWIITAYHTNTSTSALEQIGQIISPEFNTTNEQQSLDGQAFTFIFENLGSSIDYITIDFAGTKTSGIGLAFDNFQAAAIPEPSTYGAIISSLALGFVILRRRK